jgi:hypothetical protein
VKALADSNAPALDRSLKALRHIVRMNVMQRLHPYIGELERASLHKPGEDLGVEVARGIDWSPTRPHEVPGMQDRYRQR